MNKYFYLICYTGYLREQSRVAKDGVTDEQKKTFALTGGKVSTPTENLKVTKTFQAWMDDHANFRTICENGKGMNRSIKSKVYTFMVPFCFFELRKITMGKRHSS